MKTLELQLITVELDNGGQGIFVGWPLVRENTAIEDGQVENIWFSDILKIPGHLTLEQLMELLREQRWNCTGTVEEAERRRIAATATKSRHSRQ